MDPSLHSAFALVPTMLLNFLTMIVMLAISVTIYMFITPYREVALIRAGNTAAAVSLSGAMLGLALPLAFCMASSTYYVDIAIWGVVALSLQLITYLIAGLLLKGVRRRVENNEIGPSILLAALMLSVGILNAASLAI